MAADPNNYGFGDAEYFAVSEHNFPKVSSLLNVFLSKIQSLQFILLGYEWNFSHGTFRGRSFEEQKQPEACWSAVAMDALQSAQLFSLLFAARLFGLLELSD